MSKGKKACLGLVIILIVTSTVLIVSKITYAYLEPKMSDDATKSGEVTSEGDLLTFTKGAPLSLNATTDNFSSSDGNLTDTTKPTVKLTMASTAKSASATYHVGIKIDNNTFTYSDKSKPELILTVKNGNGEITTSSDTLDYVTVTDSSGNSVSGFDITGKTSVYNISEASITTDSASGTTQNWEFTLTFINYGTSLDQSVNEDATIDMDIILQQGKLTN